MRRISNNDSLSQLRVYPIQLNETTLAWSEIKKCRGILSCFLRVRKWGSSLDGASRLRAENSFCPGSSCRNKGWCNLNIKAISLSTNEVWIMLITTRNFYHWPPLRILRYHTKTVQASMWVLRSIFFIEGNSCNPLVFPIILVWFRSSIGLLDG